MKHEKIIFIFSFIFIFIFSSCCTSKQLLSDNRTGTESIRELESEIQNGDVETAKAGERLENGIQQLEFIVEESAGTESEIEKLLQKVRQRKLPADIEIKIRKSGTKAENPKNK